MRADETRRQVLAAINAGRIPRGGPSELAAHDLIDEVPAGYWERWTTGAAERVREQMRSAPCTCARPATPADDGRCSHCWGWPT